MQLADYLILLFFIVAMVATGVFYGRRLKNTADQFLAGENCPWWVSGLSAYMTMFSAGTFVVWGGIAYRFGLVAVAINLCYALAAFLAGLTLAARWKRLGFASATDFIRARYGPGAVKFYTWFNVVVGTFSLGTMVYSISVMMAAIIPLPPGHPLADAVTGQLSTSFVSCVLVALVVLYTTLGGLWAVLMTDVFQFMILSVAVLIMIPLALDLAGGWSAFLAKAPENYLSPTGGGYGWLFLAGWTAINFFKIGADWAFVQRFLCVRDARDARRTAWLFGVLYLVSPLIWMLPPMLYRTVDATASPDQAYILVCKAVLPVGLIGLMVAAMLSATASSLSGLLNVNAAAVVSEIYRKLINPHATDAQCVRAGKLATVALGAWALSGAIVIPAFGSITGFIIAFNTLVATALLTPTIWGLFSRRIGPEAVSVVVPVSIVTGGLFKYFASHPTLFAGLPFLSPLLESYRTAPAQGDVLIGVGLPCLLLAAAEFIRRKNPAPGSAALDRLAEPETRETCVDTASALPLRLSAFCLALLAVVMLAILPANTGRGAFLVSTALVLAVAAVALGVLARRVSRPLVVSASIP